MTAYLTPITVVLLALAIIGVNAAVRTYNHPARAQKRAQAKANKLLRQMARERK